MTSTSRLKKLFAVLALSFNVGCATVTIPNFKAYVTLPASENGFGIETVTRKEHTIPASKWAEMKRRGVIVLPDDWAILKETVRANCITNKCRESIGALDGLFLAIDDALKKIK